MSLHYSEIAAYQAYVQTFGRDLLTLAQIDFETAKHVDHMPMVKGVHTDTLIKKNGSLIRGYNGVFTGYDSQKLVPIQYTTDPFKTEFNIMPGEAMYKSYLGFLTSRGFKVKEWPIQRYFLSEHMLGVQAEMEVAIWEGIKDGGAAADAAIISKMDGFGERINDAITATTLTVTPTGAIVTESIVEQIKELHATFDKVYKTKNVKCFLSINHETAYYEAKGTTLQFITDEWMSKKFNTARIELVFVPGLADDKMVMTIPNNLVYNYDDVNDVNNWFFKEEHYSIEGSATMRAGTTIRFAENGKMAVNDNW